MKNKLQEYFEQQLRMIESGEIKYSGKEAYEDALHVVANYFKPSPGSKDVEQWYHNWMAAHDKAEIATVNVLDMLKDFASQQPPPVSANEWIVCSAIQYFVDGKEVIVCGLRHNNCIKTYYELTGKQTSSELEQGFITSTGRFVDRVDAGKIALSCGQIKELKYYGGTMLDSSDLYHCVIPVSAMEHGEWLWNEYSRVIPEQDYKDGQEIAEMVAGKSVMFKEDFIEALTTPTK